MVGPAAAAVVLVESAQKDRQWWLWSFRHWVAERREVLAAG